MNFIFKSLPISCEIIPLSLVLYVTRKGSLCGALLRNSSFNPCLTMSRIYLFEVIPFQFSRNYFMLPAWKLSTLFIDICITIFSFSCISIRITFFSFSCVSLTWFSNFCAGTSVCVPVPVVPSSWRGFLLKQFFSRSPWSFSSSWISTIIRSDINLVIWCNNLVI